MDQNQPVDDDLQKAIDKITSTTNVDPVFSDQVATPPIDLNIPPIESMPIPEPNQPGQPEPLEQPKEPSQPEQPAFKQSLDPTLSDLSPNGKLDTRQIKNAALRDLAPLLAHIDMDASKKFKIYRNMFDDLRDYTVLEPAYNAAREIPDEKERAEALLYLVESIDKM